MEMDRLVDVISTIEVNTCHGRLSTLQRTCIVGIGVIIHISCFLFRNWGLRIKSQKTVRQGQKAILEEIVQFNKSIKYLKWQKYRNGEYVDINIHSSKYKGTTTSLQNPVLQIHEFDVDDDVLYRLAVVMVDRTKYSEHQRIRVIHEPTEGKPGIEIYTDRKNTRYFVGEDVTIKANLDISSSVLSATWQRKTENGSQTLCTALPKYTGTKNNGDEHMLIIKNCNESDRGIYFLLAACTYTTEDVKSNELHLDIAKDYPLVTLNQVPEAINGECVQFRATIRSFPKPDRVIWMKGRNHIDITQPKYKGSSDVGDFPVLCINRIDKEDKGVYSIEVHNEIGNGTSNNVILEKPTILLEMSEKSESIQYGNSIKIRAVIKACPEPSSIQWKKKDKDGKIEKIIERIGKFIIDKSDTSCQKLCIKSLDLSDNGDYEIIVTNALGEARDTINIKVEADKIIFISGPTVVVPSANIRLRADYDSNRNVINSNWLKIKNFISNKLPFENPKYSIGNSTSTGLIRTQKVVISNAEKEEDSAAYQLSLDDMKSNKLNIFVDDRGKYSTEKEGNCLRFFALQTASASALRIAFDKMQPTFFADKIKKFKCEAQKDQKLKGLLSNLNKKSPTSSKDLDISVIYAIIRKSINLTKPKNDWGNSPSENDIDIADDLERIRLARNMICHDNALNMETSEFNKSVLDLIRAIRRLSMDDVKLMEDVCDVMNKVFTKGQIMEGMIEQLNAFQRDAKKWEQLCQNEAPVPQEDTLFIYQRSGNEEIKFHPAHDSDILLSIDGTKAIRNTGIRGGICFMNRPLKIGEKVHIRGEGYCHIHCNHMHQSMFIGIGITSIPPETMFAAEDKKKAVIERLNRVDVSCHPFTKHSGWGCHSFHLCILLCPNGSLLVSCNNTDKKDFYVNPEVSIDTTLWLVIKLHGNASACISHD